jgi:NADP-reducing hydrogenase subunit HndD
MDQDLLQLRAQGLYSIDAGKTIRRSHENPSIERLYSEYLGQPGSEKAHALLHTHYTPRLPRGIRS